MENDKILKELSTNLALYFKLGDISNYNKFTEIIESNFQFRDKESEWVTDELNKKPQSPIELMYNRYKQRKLTDFKRDIKFCQSVILDIYELKKIQMKTKQEICVNIRDEKELQQAKDMLERNGEKIDYKLSVLSGNAVYNYLQYCFFHFEWYLGRKQNLTEIPLSELESVLNGESVENKSSIDVKEKAKELIEKFGKKLAVECVDEILNICNKFLEEEGATFGLLEYYQNIKTEIENYEP